VYSPEDVRSSSGRAMVQLVSRRPPTVEAWFVTRAISCEIYGERSGNETGFCPSPSVSPVSIMQPLLHTHFHLITTLIRRATRYGAEGSGFEFRSRRNFPHRSRLAQGPTYPSVQRVSALSQG
jgi:hypothetical protein